MKKILSLVVILLLVFTLSSCDELSPVEDDFGHDYADFPNNTASTYYELENIEEERYIAYYYSELCGHCNDIKEEVLGFFSTFNSMPFYLLDVASAGDVSYMEEFIGTPSIFIIADNTVLEIFVGTTQIRSFIEMYSNVNTLVIDYYMFETQHVYSYDDLGSIDSDAYLMYYYSETNNDANEIKQDVLMWAFNRNIRDIYFMDIDYIEDAGNLPVDLNVLSSGVPMILVMSNGNYANESYSGSEEILAYIRQLGTQDITTDYYTD